MQEFLIGREYEKIELLSKLSDTVENKYFANERFNKEFLLSKCAANHCTFVNLGFRKARFSNIDFSHCVFIECYFKEAYFENVNFTNCRFVKCNFDNAKIISVNFNYAAFSGCFIDYDILKGSLPREQNLRWKICTNLSLECLRLGDDVQYRKYYFAEKEASEQHQLSKIKRADSYYKNHYSPWQSIEALLLLLTSKISKKLWGYGEKLSCLIFNIVITVLLFAGIYYYSGNSFKINGNADITSIDIIDSLYVSVCNFTTISSDITPANHFVRNATAIEGFLGVTLMGFFIAALFRFINRRS